jgi:hypothetical protein
MTRCETPKTRHIFDTPRSGRQMSCRGWEAPGIRGIPDVGGLWAVCFGSATSQSHDDLLGQAGSRPTKGIGDRERGRLPWPCCAALPRGSLMMGVMGWSPDRIRLALGWAGILFIECESGWL